MPLAPLTLNSACRSFRATVVGLGLLFVTLSACSGEGSPSDPDALPPTTGGTDSAGGGQATGSGGAAVESSGGASHVSTGGQSPSGSGGASTSSGGSPASGGTHGTGGAPPADLPALSLYIAGDSTVSSYADTASPADQAGWGQMLHEYFDQRVTVINRAAGGRTARWFYLEGGVADVLSEIQPGDYFLVQFGTNDSHKTATFTVDGTTYNRYADPATDFKAHLKEYYLDPARSAGVIPVLVTPPPRNSAYCGTGNSLGGYAQAMRELAAAEQVIVFDLNTKTFDHLAAICPAPTSEDFFFLRADGTVDGTHFQENGARQMAGFLAESVSENDITLRSYLLP